MAYFEIVQETLRSVPQGGLSRRSLFERLRPLAAAVRDGHTFMHDPWENRDPRRVWIDLEPIEDRLVVVQVYEVEHTPVLGSSVLAVGSVPIADLLQKMATLQGYDNPFGNLAHLAHALSMASSASSLVTTEPSTNSLPFQVKMSDGEELKVQVAVATAAPGPATAPPTSVVVPEPNAGDMAWSFLTSSKDVAYLRLDSMMRYR